MEDTQEWVNVGKPLIEQDAEYLKQLIDAEGYPCRIVAQDEAPDADEGRSSYVQVLRKHQRLALRVRSDQFPEPPDTTKPEPKPMSPIAARLWKCAGASAIGAMAGARVGVKMRGGAWAVAGGLVLGTLGFLAVFLMTGGRDKPGEETAQSEDTEKKK